MMVGMSWVDRARIRDLRRDRPEVAVSSEESSTASGASLVDAVVSGHLRFRPVEVELVVAGAGHQLYAPAEVADEGGIARDGLFGRGGGALGDCRMLVFEVDV
jgi:hypothetical protein